MIRGDGRGLPHFRALAAPVARAVPVTVPFPPTTIPLAPGRLRPLSDALAGGGSSWWSSASYSLRSWSRSRLTIPYPKRLLGLLLSKILRGTSAIYFSRQQEDTTTPRRRRSPAAALYHRQPVVSGSPCDAHAMEVTGIFDGGLPSPHAFLVVLLRFARRSPSVRSTI